MSDSYDTPSTNTRSRSQGGGNDFTDGGYASATGPVADSVTGQQHFAGQSGGAGEFRQEIGSELETGRGLTGDNQFSSSGNQGYSSGTQDFSDNQGLSSDDQYGSNTSAGNYASDTAGVVGDSRSQGQDQGFSSGAGLTGDGTYGGSGSYGQGQGLTGDSVVGSGQTGDNYEGDGGKSAGYGQDSGPGNQGVSGYQGSSDSGVLSGGAAGTDRFDSTSSGNDLSGDTYGNAPGDKVTTNQGIGRHGDDFTGGAVATGGAYTNPNVKTGLTGRETTTSGVQDQNGEPTQKVGLVQKVKNAIGGHKNDSNANDDEVYDRQQ